MKLGLIFYSLTFSILYLTGHTSAYFSDAASVNGVIQAGTWWDKSSLTFEQNNKSTNKKDQCTPITTIIKNSGDGNMQEAVRYEVWWSEKGNPKDGVKVSGGEVRTLKSGESMTLSYESNKDGNYKFKAYQSTGHPGQGELWSNDLTVNCSDSKKVEEPKPKENENKSEQTEEGSKVPEQQSDPQPEQEQPSEPATPETAEEPIQEPTEQVTEPETNEET
jgi:YqxM protein